MDHGTTWESCLFGFRPLVALGPNAQFKAISKNERVGVVSAFGPSSDTLILADTEHINGKCKNFLVMKRRNFWHSRSKPTTKEMKLNTGCMCYGL